MRESPISKTGLFRSLPGEWSQDPFPEIRRRVQAASHKIAVLDDDPTGTQTVHGVWVVTQWTQEALRPVMGGDSPVFYVLTNSRSLPQDQAVALNREIAANLAAAAQEAGCELDVVSRSDSTLRGHYPAEIDALRETLEPRLGRAYDGTLICPFFVEGGRLTAHDVHWVAEGETLVPAAQTEYACDVTFGYTQSNLRKWVEEKTSGRVPTADVVSISLQAIRGEGPEGVRRALAQVTGGRVAVVNAVTYRDLAVFVAGLLEAQAAGQRFLFRTAASFVKVRGGISDRRLLNSAEMLGEEMPPESTSAASDTGSGGLIVAGSYVDKTTRQLAAARKLPDLCPVQLSVRRVLDEQARQPEIDRVLAETERALRTGRDALLYTSRERVTGRGRAGELDIGQTVSAALVQVVQRVALSPRYLIAKGGITSSDVATRALGVQRAWVLGQILPGIPVWRLGPESRFPGRPYVVFPGNVGADASLADAINVLRGRLRAD
jgi:uncharacterized protein YgbK (DUF1537 family)